LPQASCLQVNATAFAFDAGLRCCFAACAAASPPRAPRPPAGCPRSCDAYLRPPAPAPPEQPPPQRPPPSSRPRSHPLGWQPSRSLLGLERAPLCRVCARVQVGLIRLRRRWPRMTAHTRADATPPLRGSKRGRAHSARNNGDCRAKGIKPRGREIKCG
jgi:hypothetical protein